MGSEGISPLEAVPTDAAPEILASGGPIATTIYMSLAARDPDGRDEQYLQWHALDHEPEQHRLATVWASRRLVSTKACRAARAVSDERYDGVDHVMTYFFAPPVDFRAFERLNNALAAGRRTPYLLPIIERGTWQVAGRAAAPKALVGADVLPKRAIRGIYLLIEHGSGPAADLTQIPGVAGVWWASGAALDPVFMTTDNTGMQVTLCYLDDDPVEVAKRLRPALQQRWTGSTLVPLLAAPFHSIVPFDWARYLP